MHIEPPYLEVPRHTQGAACARKVQPLALAASGVLAGGTQGSALW